MLTRQLLHDTILHLVCLWGSNYVLLAYLYFFSPLPAPIPFLHCLFSAGILFWLNGHKHKLSISSSSRSSAWKMKIALVKELFTSMRLGLWPAVQRKPKWKVKFAIALKSTRCANKIDFHFYHHFFLPSKARHWF